jgi:hypothetical protein
MDAVSADGHWKTLGLASQQDFDKLRAPVRKFRNRVMHPVSPLTASCQEVSTLKEQIGAVLDLSLKLAVLGKIELPGSPEGQMALQIIASQAAKPAP